MNSKNIQNIESEKWQVSKSKFGVLLQSGKEDKKQRGILEAQLEKRDKDEIQMKAQIEQIIKKKDNKIKELENEVALLKNNKTDKFNCDELQEFDYRKYKTQEEKRLENEPNRYNDWVGKLIKYT